MSLHGMKTAKAVFQTIIRPKTINFVSRALPQGFKPQSLLVVTTPQNTPGLLNAALKLHQTHPEIQIVAASCDSIAPNFTRNGIAAVWFDQYMTIADSIRLETKDDLHTPPKESDGLNPVSAKKHWKLIESSFTITVPFTDAKSYTLSLPLANTVFHDSHLLTLFYLQPESLQTRLEDSGHILADLSVTLPVLETTASHGFTASDNLEPLYTLEDKLIITDCNTNLIKTINRKSASAYLESCEKLMNLASKETEVYVRIHDLETAGDGNHLQYKVIAGGGGWGAKANILAILPEARLKEGQQVEFLMLKPETRYKKPTSKIVDHQSYINQFALECSFEETGYCAADEEGNEIFLDGVFGCGSELGYKINGVSHNSAGQLTIMNV
ncbi:hypothetical protein BABINDRAFT_10459 [Babjeviella inositovora NRRL Y-12698]|uniref:FIST domain-containing protein n=1 Tax=Babjeviella inositovora NRRL Y-12698 TaxID=984486 RepID=A0A1E3QHL6_9ASCO|nr:uncharacterized protein BABINDRAFT_10459 [Babjeviella inositovora NRRL Y-12698]ODQ77098.1 hypothetical protein BABINDRAFT_10459 [Babjeviella inositovora NRRL Y-12698]